MKNEDIQRRIRNCQHLVEVNVVSVANTSFSTEVLRFLDIEKNVFFSIPSKENQKTIIAVNNNSDETCKICNEEDIEKFLSFHEQKSKMYESPQKFFQNAI